MSRSKRHAFTLVELLVVVAIIALLISILLPSLSAARDQAKSIVCAAKLREISQGSSNYAKESSSGSGEFLPGSPGTSGNELLYTFVSPFEVNTPGDPVQVWDWSGPIAAKLYKDKNFLPRNRAKRMKLLREELFRCPNNSFLSPPWNGSVGPWPSGGFPQNQWEMMTLNSFSTAREFMYFGWQEDFSSTEAGVHLPNWGIRTPAGYKPAYDLIENPSKKAHLFEGTRYMDNSLYAPDTDINPRADFGGGFADSGPCSSYTRAFLSDGNEWHQGGDPFAWRHRIGSEPANDVLYFDGRVERLPKLNATLQIDTWWPSRSIIQTSEMTGGPNPKARAAAVLTTRTQEQPGWYPIY